MCQNSLDGHNSAVLYLVYLSTYDMLSTCFILSNEFHINIMEHLRYTTAKLLTVFSKKCEWLKKIIEWIVSIRLFFWQKF